MSGLQLSLPKLGRKRLLLRCIVQVRHTIYNMYFMHSRYLLAEGSSNLERVELKPQIFLAWGS